LSVIKIPFPLPEGFVWQAADSLVEKYVGP
jgi:hypothetical protein